MHRVGCWLLGVLNPELRQSIRVPSKHLRLLGLLFRDILALTRWAEPTVKAG